ncbi:hypothetical protein B296_00001085 [Ensete ventricosum]|uniref:Uncharacterized protein n=1 Tax=Ensete ventricosum TaxID=4639 RepID=A0A426ZF88_ENSVE|nr:hypothetical protein B296_00001085 [Ensete ventricosum]
MGKVRVWKVEIGSVPHRLSRISSQRSVNPCQSIHESRLELPGKLDSGRHKQLPLRTRSSRCSCFQKSSLSTKADHKKNSQAGAGSVQARKKDKSKEKKLFQDRSEAVLLKKSVYYWCRIRESGEQFEFQESRS